MPDQLLFSSKMKCMKTGGFFRDLFNPTVIFGALGLGIILAAITLGLLWLTRPTMSSLPAKAAELKVIAAPTNTPVPPTPTPQPTNPPIVEGQFGMGSTVQVSGTGGDGLRLRVAPGLSEKVRVVGQEGEVFTIEDGPREVDGYTWWYLVVPGNTDRSGWAVANFLQAGTNP